MTKPPARPVVRMRPKTSARAVRFGAPWVYADELVLDRRTRAIAPGTVVELHGNDRRPLAAAAFNPNSKIAIRVLDSDPAAKIGSEWLAEKFRRALALREDLFDAPYYRLCHAEADGLPGLIADRFGDTIVVQPNSAWAAAVLDTAVDALASVSGASALVVNGTGRARALEGLDSGIRVLRGKVDGPLDVPMNGAVYKADLLGGQKTGLFYDQRPNHALAARLARGRDVLDVFAHVGGFSLAALRQGAASALAVDASAAALELAAGGALATGVSDRFSTQRSDAFEAMASLRDARRRFGLVVCDPPAFAPNRASLVAGLRAYEKVARLAASLVRPGGFVVLCSCSHAAGLPAFREACLRGVGRAGRQAQIIHTGTAGPDHPVHPYLAESAYLKALFLRLD
ncbi:MAG: RSP_2647 family RNA methyltransferase [Paracoccaceae bacterium]